MTTSANPAVTGQVAPPAPRDTAPHWAVLPVVLAGVFLSGLDFFIVNVAIPSSQQDLHANQAQIQFIIAGYALAHGVGMITGGRLGDLYGRDWRSCFLINLPIGLAAVLLTLRIIPESKAPGRPRLDLAGMILVTVALLAVVLPLIEGRLQGWPAWTWVLLAAAIPLFAIFAVHQNRLRRAGGS